MRAVEIWESLLSKPDKEVIKIARYYGVELTIDEVRQLRPLAEQANITWLVTGIPKSVLKEAERILGPKKFRQYKKLLDSYSS
ncbi:DUF2624 family protein [Ureibacillus manganicus]|uniref:Uncharacterized protein n=1 Tax=Ureibacillus manganicus DSM 26584 TaxID=1384049 RepID=A0A0A3I1B0_9BACL|nr:DUF2624 family protein [Ureibacillus manganicus]KGR78509.1 hypothetical protein CD29_10705 [Ureibacillus manganicus DSM 26584]